MKKKVLLGLLIFVGLFIITGCDKNGESSLNANSENKTYTCKNTSNSSGLKYLTSYTIEF